MNPAERAVAALLAAGAQVAVAESLTGGLVCLQITDVPGSSQVFPGGVVSYEVNAKAGVLGVDKELLDRFGPVHPEVARQMAAGVARLFSADYAVATTGVAGPEPHGGFPPGVVVIGWFAQGETGAQSGRVPGDRTVVRRETAEAALRAVTECVEHGEVRNALLPPTELV